MDETPRRRSPFQRNLIAGLLTIAPLFAVWLVFNFLLGVLSTFGGPLAARLTVFLDQDFPAAAPWLADPRMRLAMAVVVALLVLYGIGAFASRVIGQRLIGLFERIIGRIPLVQTIYSAAKKLVDVLQQKPGNDQRVALLDWPHPGMKTVAFVMRIFSDAKTGAELAALYVPSALNPTSGFLQIVPVAQLTFLDISTDQAMTMIISSGAIVPDRMSIAAPQG
ncbi:MAG TPA: DUF502 domain-containing protein [Rhizomicrobium sp.]|nr:DUF502 domain-containing protein [Rhizomicrobium sp.]